MSCLDCEEYEEMLRTTMDEKCTANEKHCTCVPILRRRIAELEGVIGELIRDIERLTRRPGDLP